MAPQSMFLFKHRRDNFLCHWAWSEIAGTWEFTHVINLQIRQVDSAQGADDHENFESLPTVTSESALAVLDYLTDAACSCYSDSGSPDAWIKLILPAKSGYVARSDFLKLRMVACRSLQSIHHFVKHQKYLEVLDVFGAQTTDFFKALSSAAGAITSVPSRAADFDAVMGVLDEELANRLSYPWVVQSPLTRNLTDIPMSWPIISHRHPDVMANYLTSCYAHGIRVTLVDAKGGFAPEEKRFNAVEQCIEVDMTRDEHLTSRIVEALSSGAPYHGIVTFTDTYMIYTAEAATALGLYTLPLHLVKTCLDKHATRLFCQDAKESLRITGLVDLKNKLKSPDTQLEYPLIIKPCTAWGSQGVYKVVDELQLLEAVSRAGRSASNSDLVIDSYVDGPEVDANFVLLDGRILYFELVDGFPCTAEVPNGGKLGDFIETDQMWPSNHPQREKDLVRDKLHDLLIRMGIRDGVFHVEARIKNSAVQYEMQDGVFDLYPRNTLPTEDPSIFLLEVNQRPPGHGGSWGTSVSYGIDYPVLHMFCALREFERYQALSQPFKQRAVQHVDSVFINSDTNGTYAGGDLCSELKEQRPDLAEHVQYCNTYYEKGETILDSPARIALFVVASPISRRKVLEISRELQDAVKVRVM